eukprot:12469503-Heterocapsa_arctica.AAC.1
MGVGSGAEHEVLDAAAASADRQPALLDADDVEGGLVEPGIEHGGSASERVGRVQVVGPGLLGVQGADVRGRDDQRRRHC